MPNLKRLPLNNPPNILRAIRRITPFTPLTPLSIPPPLSQIHNEPILTHHHRRRRLRSIRRTKRRDRLRIANLPNQNPSCNGIQNRIHKTAGRHQRSADAVEGQGDAVAAPDGETACGEREGERDIGDGVDDHEARGAADLVGACGAGGGADLLYAATEEDEDVRVDYHAAELRGEDPEVVEGETLKIN